MGSEWRGKEEPQLCFSITRSIPSAKTSSHILAEGITYALFLI